MLTTKSGDERDPAANQELMENAIILALPSEMQILEVEKGT